MAAGSGRIAAGVGVLIALVAVGGLAWMVLRPGESTLPPETMADGAPAVGGGAERAGERSAPVLPGPGEALPGSVMASPPLPAGFARAIVRGVRGQWYALAYPEAWELDPASDQYQIATHAVAGGPGALVKLQVERGEGVAGVARELPEGTTTTDIEVDGRPATRYDLPTELLPEGGVACSVLVAVGAAAPSSPDPSDRNELMIDFWVLGVAEEADCQAHLADLEQVLQLLRFLPDTTSAGRWQAAELSPSPVADIRRIDVALPEGWLVTGSPGTVVIQSNGTWPGGSVLITAAPLQGAGYFDTATDVPGGLGPGVRLISSASTAGVRTTEYVTSDSRPVKWLVVQPEIAPEEPGYWENDQAVWRIMTESAFSHDLSTGYP